MTKKKKESNLNNLRMRKVKGYSDKLPLPRSIFVISFYHSWYKSEAHTPNTFYLIYLSIERGFPSKICFKNSFEDFQNIDTNSSILFGDGNPVKC